MLFSPRSLLKLHKNPIGCVPSAAVAARGACIPACTGQGVSGQGVSAQGICLGGVFALGGVCLGGVCHGGICPGGCLPDTSPREQND